MPKNEILLVEWFMIQGLGGHVLTTNAPLQPLLGLDRLLEKPNLINQLVMSSLNTYIIKS